MRGKLYIVIKRNGNKYGLEYDKRLYYTRRDAENDFRKSDTLLICNASGVYYADDFFPGWRCDSPLKIIKK